MRKKFQYPNSTAPLLKMIGILVLNIHDIARKILGVSAPFPWDHIALIFFFFK